MENALVRQGSEQKIVRSQSAVRLPVGRRGKYERVGLVTVRMDGKALIAMSVKRMKRVIP